MRNPDALIVGGGPAGAAAAITLAKAGLRPVVVERAALPQDALCGGFLSWSTAARLKAFGIDPEALGARPVDTVRMVARSRSAQARLPHRCWSLSRRVLDVAMLDQAEQTGVSAERGVKAAELGDGHIILSDGAKIESKCIVVATGKHDLRGVGRSHEAQDPYLGLRWKLAGGARLDEMLSGTVELHLFEGGYAGLALQEDGSANLCMAARRSVLAAAGGDPVRLLARLADANALLASRIEAAGDDPGSAQAIANVPYGWIASTSASGTYRVGDQAAVIPSMAGEGIAIALASGAAAGRAILDDIDAFRFQRGFSDRAKVPVRVAGAIARIGAHRAGALALVGSIAVAPGLAGWAAGFSRIGPAVIPGR